MSNTQQIPQDMRSAILGALLSCPHSVDSASVVLEYDAKVQGKNALSQTVDRLQELMQNKEQELAQAKAQMSALTERLRKLLDTHHIDHASEASASELVDTYEQQTLTIQEAWDASGANPQIKATREDLLANLQLLDEVCEEADQNDRHLREAEFATMVQFLEKNRRPENMVNGKTLALVAHEYGLVKDILDIYRQNLKRAQQKEAWRPDVCPLTGHPFFMWLQHPKMGLVPTYGGPLDSYTIPAIDSRGEYCRERYDHDEGAWVETQAVGLKVVDDQLYTCDLDPAAIAQDAARYKYLLDCEFTASKTYLPDLDKAQFLQKRRQAHDQQMEARLDGQGWGA